MGEYIGKINVPKDTMLFVVNSVFKKGIKESTTKENILKMIPEIYENADPKEIIKLLPYRTYMALEDLIEYVKTSDDINKFYFDSGHSDVRYLEEAMIIMMRAKHMEYNYSLNPGVIEKLGKLFSKENKELAKRYGRIEDLTKGMMYSYGAVEFEFLRTQICKYMKEIISEDELYDIYFQRLNLNLDVNYYNVRWTNTNQVQQFVTYLDEEEIDVGYIVDEQKARGLRYKNFKEQEILNREEYLWDESTKKLYEYIKSKNENIWEYPFQRIIKKSELGENILSELTEKCRFEDEEDIKEFMDLFIEWYNNSPQYQLGGYSPVEFRKLVE